MIEYLEVGVFILGLFLLIICGASIINNIWDDYNPYHLPTKDEDKIRRGK